MSQILSALFLWAHALATAVFIGYYLVLRAIVLPALSTGDNGPALSAISRRSRPWLYASLAVFFVTGAWLMFVDADYLGFMQMGNAWSILMLVKHLLILAMIGLGFWFNAVQRVGPLMQSPTRAEEAIARFRSHTVVMALAGALVLLLTALAQA
jgi:uncharacterized membrane protein